MNQGLADPQMQFALPVTVDSPVMAPVEKVGEFEGELDAINYAIDSYSQRNGYSFTQTNLAEQLGMTKQTLSKLRQGDISIPRNRFRRLIEVTRSYAPLQFHAYRLGLILRTREQEQGIRSEADRAIQENAVLREENKCLAEQLSSYKRAMGE